MYVYMNVYVYVFVYVYACIIYYIRVESSQISKWKVKRMWNTWYWKISSPSCDYGLDLDIHIVNMVVWGGSTI